jgi:hypothetical protein
MRASQGIDWDRMAVDMAKARYGLDLKKSQAHVAEAAMIAEYIGGRIRQDNIQGRLEV